MRLDAAVDALARFAVAVILSALIVASFSLPSPRATVTGVDVAPPDVSRVAPVSLVRDREPIAELAPQPVGAHAMPEPPPTPAPAPVMRVASVETSSPLPKAEERMLALVNASRAQQGLPPLALDDAVSAVARRHSAVETQHGYVYHDGPDGTARSRDAAACGSGWYGENTGKVWNANVDVLHAEFMAEPWAPINHRTNIMDPEFRRAGVGATFGADAIYITVVFCR